jgi:hypothetical protein
MFAYRERRPASPGYLPGAARVQFPTAGSAEFKCRPRDERGGRVCDCPTGPSGRMRSKQLPDCSSTPEPINRASGVPIPRAALRPGSPRKR